jgi:uncharacterized protein (DUF2336 family)
MIIRQFLLWTRTAPPEHRAEAVGALARVALQGDLAPEHQEEAERALLAMLDDPSAMVRLAVAKAFAPSEHTPRPLLAALLGDEPEIAALVLEASPVLTDAELIDQAALADVVGQRAIARRPMVSPGLAGAIAEVGCASAVLELLGNPGATIATISLARIVERFGQDALIRDVCSSETISRSKSGSIS